MGGPRDRDILTVNIMSWRHRPHHTKNRFGLRSRCVVSGSAFQAFRSPEALSGDRSHDGREQSVLHIQNMVYRMYKHGVLRRARRCLWYRRIRSLLPSLARTSQHRPELRCFPSHLRRDLCPLLCWRHHNVYPLHDMLHEIVELGSRIMTVQRDANALLTFGDSRVWDGCYCVAIWSKEVFEILGTLADQGEDGAEGIWREA